MFIERGSSKVEILDLEVVTCTKQCKIHRLK